MTLTLPKWCIMYAETFFYWFGVGSFILALPIFLFAILISPAIIGALIFGVLDRSVNKMDVWWDSIEEFEQAREDGDLKAEVMVRTSNAGIWVESAVEKYGELLDRLLPVRLLQ